MSGEGHLSNCARDPAPPLGGDHLVTVRRAVAEACRGGGLPLLAAEIERGAMDDNMHMRAGIAAAKAVLWDLFG